MVGGAGGVPSNNVPSSNVMAAGVAGAVGAPATAGIGAASASPPSLTIPSLFGAGGGFQFFQSPPVEQQPVQPTMQGPSVAMPDFMGVPLPAYSSDPMPSAIPPMPFGQAEVAQVALPGNRTPPEGFQPGDHIEVWSKSLNNWCPGVVEYLEGYMVYVKFRAPSGHFL